MISQVRNVFKDVASVAGDDFGLVYCRISRGVLGRGVSGTNAGGGRICGEGQEIRPVIDSCCMIGVGRIKAPEPWS